MITSSPQLSAAAQSIQDALEHYDDGKEAVAVYKAVPDEDLLILISSTGLHGGPAITEFVLELGWLEHHNESVVWSSEWLAQLSQQNKLANFYAFTKKWNENVSRHPRLSVEAAPQQP